MEVRTSWTLSLWWEASRAFSSSALDTYWLTCGRPCGHLQLALQPPVWV